MTKLNLEKCFDTSRPITIDINLIKEHPDNPRIANDKAMKLLKKSLKEFGTVEPLLVTQDYVLLSGHARLRVMKEQNVKEVVVNVALKPLSIKQQQKLLLYLNQNSLKDSSNFFDYDKLANDWDLDFLKDDVGLTDWDLGLGVSDKEEIDLTADLTEDKDFDDNIIDVKDVKSVFFAHNNCKFEIPYLQENMLLDCNIDDMCAKKNQEIDSALTYLIMYNSFSADIKFENNVVGFFLHDKVFEGIYNQPYEVLSKLLRYNLKGILAPNFSLWSNEPYALQIHNWYKTQWCSRYAQEMGIKVMPTLNWSDENSYDFCFSGIPKYAKKVICQSRNLSDELAQKRFLKGLIESHSRLEFGHIYIYGGYIKKNEQILAQIPKHISWSPVKSLTEKIAELFAKNKTD